MSQQVNLEDLKQRLDKSRADYEKFVYETYEPRFYKKKVGRKQEYVNPWKDLAERDQVEKKMMLLWEVWNKLNGIYVTATGEYPKLPLRYIEKETPDGPRWVKVEGSASSGT